MPLKARDGGRTRANHPAHRGRDVDGERSVRIEHNAEKERSPRAVICRHQAGLLGFEGTSPSLAPVLYTGYAAEPRKLGPASPEGTPTAADEDATRRVSGGGVSDLPKPGPHGWHRGGRRPHREAGIPGRQAGRPEYGRGGPDAPSRAVPEREYDEGDRFTNRPSAGSHRVFRPSACAVPSCGLAAHPPVAGRAASAVGEATPRPRAW